MFPKKLQLKIDEREANSSLRKFSLPTNLIDFSSNDYLGFSTSTEIYQKTEKYLKENKWKNGATGSRLLSGNTLLYKHTEEFIANVHQSEAALLFNSGYDANLGFFSSVPQKGDFIFYDENIHASVRDGIQLSHAKGYKFKHNDILNLEKLFIRIKNNTSQNKSMTPNFYVVTESVFSMDGDSPDLQKLVNFCIKNQIHLIVDEAHALGVFGLGLVQKLQLEDQVFARLVTFGKGLGCHGAAILGSSHLKKYLINFARSLIYTTALPPHSIATILGSYHQLKLQINSKESPIATLHKNIQFFKNAYKQQSIESFFIESNSAIHSCVLSGNQKVQFLSEKLREKNFDVKAILSPTVAKGKERLRFCLHSYNTNKEILEMLQLVSLHLNSK